MTSVELYFDYNASTPVHPEVAEAAAAHLHDVWGNSSAGHAEGRRARMAIAGARADVAAALGAQPGEVYFTSGGTESNNWAVRGVAEAAGSGHIVCGRHEHSSVLRPVEWLEQRGFAVTWLEPGPSGRLTREAVEGALRPDTKLVALMFANNETGVLQPAREVAELCRERRVRTLVDAVCGVGKARVDFTELGCDLLALAGHKVHAPKGVGALVVRRGVVLAPLVLGCGQQEGRRSGTENTLGAVALGRALALSADGAYGSPERVEVLRDRLWQGIALRFPAARRNGEGPILSNTLNVWFPGAPALDLQARLAARGASVAAAASALDALPSHVLLAMGLSPERALESVRISLGSGTTDESVDRLLALLEEAVPAATSAVGALS